MPTYHVSPLTMVLLPYLVLIGGRFVLYWLFGQDAGFTAGVVLQFLFSLCLFYLLSCILQPVFSAGAALALEAVLIQASAVKINHTGEPVSARDLIEIQQAFSLSSYAPFGLYVALGLFVLFVVLGWHYRSRSLKAFIARVPLALPIVLLLWVFTWNGGAHAQSVRDALCRYGVCYYSWAPLANARVNGSLAHLIMTSEAVKTPQAGPHGFYDSQANRASLMPDSSPDVVMILCESCFTSFDDSFKTDFYRLKQQGFQPFTLLSPVYGGNTPEAELETLTGLSSAVFAGVDYQVFFDRYRPDADTLASRFLKAGYATVSLHNFKADFWKRDVVHPRLGFERLVFLEQMGANASVGKDWRPSDKLLYNAALKEYSAMPAEQPAFMYLLTMYSHGDYLIKDNDFGEADYRKRLKQAMDDMAAFIGSLEAAAKKKGRPLVIVVFGDHKPPLTGAFYRHGVLPKELFSLPANKGKAPDFVLQPSYRLWKERAKISAFLRLPNAALSRQAAARLNDKPMFCLPVELSTLVDGRDDNFWRAVNAVCERSDEALMEQSGNAWAQFFPEAIYAERLF